MGKRPPVFFSILDAALNYLAAKPFHCATESRTAAKMKIFYTVILFPIAKWRGFPHRNLQRKNSCVGNLSTALVEKMHNKHQYQLTVAYPLGVSY